MVTRLQKRIWILILLSLCLCWLTLISPHHGHNNEIEDLWTSDSTFFNCHCGIKTNLDVLEDINFTGWWTLCHKSLAHNFQWKQSMIYIIWSSILTIVFTATTCGIKSYLRGKGQKIIGFSYYGDSRSKHHQDKKYFEGIKNNLKLLPKYYPDWIIRLYYDVSSDDPVLPKLCSLSCQNRSSQLLTSIVSNFTTRWPL